MARLKIINLARIFIYFQSLIILKYFSMLQFSIVVFIGSVAVGTKFLFVGDFNTAFGMHRGEKLNFSMAGFIPSCMGGNLYH